MRKPKWVVLAILFLVALFLGYAIFTALAMAFAPSVASITQPLLCDGEYNIKVTRSSYRPGETYWVVNILCDGYDITFPSVALTGLFASLIFFVILLVAARRWVFAGRHGSAPLAQAGMPVSGKDKTPLERMAELKEMRDKDFISQVEYERKKDDIMKEL